MKTLLFFRHGKSDWNASFESDHERPVNDRGRRAARRMGKFLADAGQLPDGIITSSAVRARTTLELAMQEGKWEDVPFEVTDRLYSVSAQDVLTVVRDVADEVERLLLVGHEPTWSVCVGRLVGAAKVRIPTGAIARVDLDVSRWQDADFGQGELHWLVVPKLLD